MPDTSTEKARVWLEKIQALKFDSPMRIMNVCDGHERSITHAQK